MAAPAASGFAFSAPHLSTLWAAARRFPFALAACLGFATLMIIENHGGFGLSGKVLEPLAYGLVVSFFASLALGLAAEAQSWPRERLWLANALLVVMVVLWVYGLGPRLGTPHYLLGAALLGLCMVAPRFGSNSDEAFWLFNQQSYYGIAVGGIAVAVFLIGITAVTWAFSLLFNGSMGLSLDLTILIISVFWPLYTITFIPRLPLVVDGAPTYPAPLSFVLCFVALPVLLVYGAIIALYGVQLVFLGHTPVSSVSWMVIGFAAAGVALHTLLYPLRDSGNLLVRFYYRFFYYLLVPLLGLLFWAVLVRMRAYGVTENRYLVVLGGLWAAALCIILLLRGRFALWVPPAMLSVLLLLASFGPWGAEGVSFRSQERRLESVLQQAGILQNGKLAEGVVASAPWEVRRNLSSLLSYFHNRRDGQMPQILHPLRNLLNDFNGEDYVGWPQLVMRQWGQAFVSSYEQRDMDGATPAVQRIYYVSNFNVPRRQAEHISGYDYLLPFTSVTDNGVPFRWQDVTLALRLNEKTSELVVLSAQAELARVNILELLGDRLEQAGTYINGPVLQTAVPLSAGRLHLRVESLELQKAGLPDGAAETESQPQWHVSGVTGTLFWKSP